LAFSAFSIIICLMLIERRKYIQVN
jgi:hypothetical protein